MPLLRLEERFFKIHEKVENYFDDNFYDIDLKELHNDKHFISVAAQKYNISEGMKRNYKNLLTELVELKKLINLETTNKCN